MVLSMTGYGRAEQVLNGRDIVVELRSVNSRFFEYSSRVPRTCSFLEDKLKKLVAAKVSRGKVELNLSIQNVAAADTVVQVNWQLAKSYQTAMQAMSEKLDLKNDVTVSTICRFPDVLTQTAAPADPDTLWADVEQVAQQAVAAFVSMRAVEGEKLRTDVLNRLAAIETLVAQIEQNSAGRVQAYTERLGFPHADTKALQVDFTHGTLGNDAVVAVAVVLFIVGGVMLDSRAAALVCLYTARHRSGHLTGDERILGVILKICARSGSNGGCSAPGQATDAHRNAPSPRRQCHRTAPQK